MQDIEVKRLLADDVCANDTTDINVLLKILSKNSSQVDLSDLLEWIEESFLYVVRTHEGRIVGIATLIVGHASSRIGYVENVVVAPEMRGKGVARALMRAILDHAQSISVKRLKLTSNKARIEAHALYRSLDFVEYDTRYFVLHL